MLIQALHLWTYVTVISSILLTGSNRNHLTLVIWWQ